jgi:hypothetical protein
VDLWEASDIMLEKPLGGRGGGRGLDLCPDDDEDDELGFKIGQR